MGHYDITEFLAQRLVKPLHSSFISGRRIDRLSAAIARMLPQGQSLKGLDVGCGQGEIAARVQQLCPQISLDGVEVLVRHDAAIPVTKFDGKRLPFAASSFDFVMLIDVVHHVENQLELLRECSRVANKFVLIKDHYCESIWDNLVLRFMDWIGNRAYAVTLPYSYLSRKRWEQLLEKCDLFLEEEIMQLDLYGAPWSLVLEANLHFMARLCKKSQA